MVSDGAQLQVAICGAVLEAGRHEAPGPAGAFVWLRRAPTRRATVELTPSAPTTRGAQLA